MDHLDFERDGRAWPNRSASRIVRAAGFDWHVQVFGSGPSLLLVHGTGASTHSWRQIAPLLSPHFTLVVPDLPGHGFTAAPPASALTLPGMAASLGDLIDTLDITPVLVAGHSAGAAVLIRMALDRRIAPRSIISINGALLPFDGFAGQFFSPLAKLLFLNPFIPRLFAWRALDVAAVRRLLTETGSKVTDEDVALYGKLFATDRHCASALGMMARWDLQTFARDLPLLKIPLVLIAGENDRAIRPADAHRVATKVANSRVVSAPGTGHLTHEERPDFVAAIIRNAANS